MRSITSPEPRVIPKPLSQPARVHREDELLADYTPELTHLAHRFSGGDACLHDDLFQEGAIGLVNAARRFDPLRGVKFSTHARLHIRGRMLNYLRKERRHRGCISLEESSWSARDHDGRGQEQEGCPPITTTEALHQIEDFLSHIELLLLEKPMCAITQLLTARQHEIFSMRYSQGLRPSEIARALGVSPARVSQVLTEAVAKLRQTFVPVPDAQ